MEKDNKPLFTLEQQVEDLSLELSKTKELLRQKTTEADKLQTASTEQVKETSRLQTKVEEMTAALEKAKEKLFEQRDMLEALTREPLPLATVIKTYMNDPGIWADHGKYFRDDAGHNEYKIGLIVRIKPGSERAHESLAEGEIKARPKRGWVTVEFEDGMTSSYETTDLLLKDRDAMDRDKYGTAVLHFEGRLVEVIFPEHLHGKLQPGDMVRLSPKTKQIVDKTESIIIGSIGTVTEIIDDESCEVAIGSGTTIVYKGVFADVKKNDRVVLDYFNAIIVKNLGKNETSYTIEELIEVSWDDVGGLEEAKQLLRETIEDPHRFTSLYEAYRQEVPKGILLLGPPGCGKTLLAMALATALFKDIYKVTDKEAMQSGFIYIKGPEILNMYLGNSEGAIRMIFARAREHFKKHGFPAVIFFDEVEAIASKRGTSISSDIDKTLVPTLLAEMSGMESSGALVLAATNRADMLDPAFVRDGRFDYRIAITRPTRESAEQILGIHAKKKPLAEGLTLESVKAKVAELIFSGTYKYYELSYYGEPDAQTKVRPTLSKFFTLQHILNGAMLKGIVSKATASAIRRDKECPDKKPSGITEQDFIGAIELTFRQNIGLDHQEPLDEFIENEKIVPINIVKCTTAKDLQP